MWRRAASRAGAELRAVEVVLADVELHRARLAGRRRDIPDFPEPTWDDVERRRAEWEPWPEARLVLDGAAPIETSVAAALASLQQ